MKIRTFGIRFAQLLRERDERVLNDFMSGVRVLRVKSAVLRSQGEWAVSVLYEDLPDGESSPQADADGISADGMTGRQRQRFDALLLWRDERAAATGQKTFSIATDRDLNNVARSEISSPSDLHAVAGFDTRKTERYGNEIVAVLDSV